MQRIKQKNEPIPGEIVEEDMSEPASVIPVFPLPNLVLFPKLQLPLHIFEPRYREMVRDAIARGEASFLTDAGQFSLDKIDPPLI